ncbi:tRNA (N6-isopentenyl adenosine(37)-C2)-methylthiotransferase MiaB, partial [Patescibacteria group bacterium]
MSRSYYIQTLGCQMNYSDSERIDTVLQHLGLTKTDEMNKADLILFNTCSIRQKG